MTDHAAPDPAVPTRRLTQRYLVLHGVRWLPTGLLIPITVLLFTSRGYSLAEFGVVGTIMATTTFLLELPTGGLADALGRKRVLVVASAFLLAATAILVVIASSSDRPSFWLVVVAMMAMGVYRALESGPLDAWYVDALHALDDNADVEAGLGRAGTVAGLSIAVGSLAAGGILAWDPVPSIDVMALVLSASLALVVAQVVALVVLMEDPGPATGTTALADAVRDAPRVVTSTLALARTNRVLGLLLLTEATWSVGMVSFENLFPVRLATLAGSAETAAALLGPASAGAWAASGAGAAVVVQLSRRIGAYRAAAALRVVQGATIVAMGLIAGVAGAITGLIATYLVHGASGPVHLALVHRQVDASRRATALSLNSMVAFAAFSVAGIGVGALADAWSVPAATVTCAVVTALGGAFVLRARTHDPDPGRAAVDGGTDPEPPADPGGRAPSTRDPAPTA